MSEASLLYVNHLVSETSPYLLQHAHNPVDWYPWGETALQRARQENKPILLSIGYSACHWCHVMAHESFENPATAALMNALFINIKVDREERPDLDKIYQTAHQLLAQRAGGWPLTMFLTPGNQQPFFGGTYFPESARHGLPAFSDLLHRVAEVYRHRHAEVCQQAQAVTQALSQSSAVQAGAPPLDAKPLRLAREQLLKSFDESAGGFGHALKFPHLTDVAFLLRCHARTQGGDAAALHAALHSLEKMALGGIYDQLGGGFCRYSVDDEWMIPHFEKMLYDNGPFLSIYSQAWQLQAQPLFQRVALETADWALREMQAADGGFYSSLDADSAGEEGRFYVWTPAELKAHLDAADYPLFARHFGVGRIPNFEQHWHLYVSVPRETLAQEFQLSLEAVDARLACARNTLLAVRAQRVRPGCDDKCLTAWNAWMIKGLAMAGPVFNRPDYVAAAERALAFIQSTLWDGQRLCATYRAGKAHLAAYLDDYAGLLDALLALLSARWRTADLRFACTLADTLLAQFEDKQHGGFYFTAHDHEPLIQRPKPFMDEALASGNGVAAWALGRLGHLLGETRYLQAAERTLHAAWPSILQVPYAHASLLAALEEILAAPQVLVLRGTPEQLALWQNAVQQAYAPQRWCVAIPNDAPDLPASLAARQPQGDAVAYLCSDFQCSAPLTELDQLLTLLRSAKP